MEIQVSGEHPIRYQHHMLAFGGKFCITQNDLLLQAEKCLGLYESAIRLLQKGQLKESQRMLKNLIESDLLQKIDNDVSGGHA